MCLDNKKLLILDTDMATNPCMYSGTQKKQHKKKRSKVIVTELQPKWGDLFQRQNHFGTTWTRTKKPFKSFIQIEES